MLVADPLWFKDAVIYQLHIKSFFDGNNDGIGDFVGLLQKLDYLQSLGVTALWLLPFYPSPLRDDGYDISDYRSINPAYGTMRDFRAFVRAAHARGLRVITELVINHTSDQHPWFQRARQAKRGSSARNFYVWSNDDRKWSETRIIFTDTESSNWTWDPVAQQYYWHRFFSHQPDLNFDNPRVVQAVIDIMRYWLDMGVDGLRLDAIPYLVERDGTNNENLAETHAVIKRLRAALDESHPHAFFLAEANQWPEDTCHYFGDGDECQMCFHFPLMPRMYMAIAQEDRHPITDIMRQTPEVPDNCQWAIFLRNHDELTLEMVTDRERDYLWEFYAADKRARINLGIRRRLAPLMQNDTRKVKLLNALLFSMSGTPIVYYGDEIGMGDNIYLGDRDSVRTPMQWSNDRNGGFSRVDSARLFLPAITDPIYGFPAINVEAQQQNSASLLNWMRQMINVRKRHQAFGRGGFTMLYPGNRKVLAYVRALDGETILCVFNLARSAQAVELDLSAYKGRVPIEMCDHSSFPPVGDLPYLLTLSGYGYYWFLLAEAVALPSWHEAMPEPMPDLSTLVIHAGWAKFPGSRAAREFERRVLPAVLAKQRWFAAKDRAIARTEVIDLAVVAEAPAEDKLLVLITVSFADGGEPQRYFLPLTAYWDESLLHVGSSILPFTLAKVRRGGQVGALVDTAQDEGMALALVDGVGRGADVPALAGRIAMRSHAGFAERAPGAGDRVRALGVEQSNSSCVIGDRMVLKSVRRLADGIHPEVEVGYYLSQVARFANVPPLLGTIEYHGADGSRMALAVLQGLVRHQGDGWTYTTEFLQRELGELRYRSEDAEVTPADRFQVYVPMAATLGRRTAEMHRAFAEPTGLPAFEPEPFTAADRDRLVADARVWAARAHAALEAARPVAGRGGFAETIICYDDGAVLLDRFYQVERLIARAATLEVEAAKTRVHGDFHLGQTLVTQADFVFVDFEGEPARTLADRRRKTTPLRDVAGLLRSFDYAAWSAASYVAANDPAAGPATYEHAIAWRDLVSQVFLVTYLDTAAGLPSLPGDPAVVRRLLDLLVLEKALYEICYEAANRPDWLSIPERGVLALLDAADRGDGDGEG